MTDHEHLFQRALDHHAAGRLAEASELYQELLESRPDHADALYMLGVVAHQAGEPEHAVALMQRALAAVPDQARCYNILGLNLMALGKPDEVEVSFRRAIALDDGSSSYNNLGVFYKAQGRLDDAIEAFQQAVARAPGDAGAHSNLGDAYRAKGELAAAADCFRRAVQCDPADAELHCDLGDLLQTLNRLADAIAEYQQALQLNPKLARAWYSAGCAESSRQDFAPATGCFRKALEIHPDWPEAQHNLARAVFKLGQVEEALELFRRAAAGGDPALPEAAIAVVIPGSPASDNQAVLEARSTWAARHLPLSREVHRARRIARPLRIGYVSAFFADHNWMKPVWGLINQHDRHQFAIHLFSDAPASKIEYGYRAAARDRFHDTTGLGNDALAQLIEDEQIDLLVDLNGYSTMGRLALFTMRPAPVIAGWFNMFATTGIPSYDYLIGDDVVIPPEEEKFYCEKIVRVPGSYLTFDVSYPVPEVAEPPFLRDGTITFGCLAPQYKITGRAIAAWGSILKQVPRSLLILKSRTFAFPGACQLVHEMFAGHGVDPGRVRLDGPSKHYQFLETYGEIDIALDTFPYNGGTTTTEAIWQGVPVVTFYGDRWVSRTSASLLHAGNLSQLVGQSLEDYITLAVNLAQAPDRLAELRRTMRVRLRNSPVCDTQSFARNMEQLYLQMTS